MYRDRGFCGGFTLVEILIALAVLGIVITSVAGMFTSSAQRNLASRRNTVALTVAGDIMDRIKAGDINSTNIGDEIDNYKAVYGVEIKVDAPGASETGGLTKLKVFVTPFEGMNPETEGVLLSSYAIDVYVPAVDTSAPQAPAKRDGQGEVLK